MRTERRGARVEVLQVGRDRRRSRHVDGRLDQRGVLGHRADRDHLVGGRREVARSRGGTAVALRPDTDHAGVGGRVGRLHHRVGPVERVLMARAPGVAQDVGAVGDRILDRLHELDDPAVAVLEPVGRVRRIEDPVVHEVRRRRDAADRQRLRSHGRVRVTRDRPGRRGCRAGLRPGPGSACRCPPSAGRSGGSMREPRSPSCS